MKTVTVGAMLLAVSLAGAAVGTGLVVRVLNELTSLPVGIENSEVYYQGNDDPTTFSMEQILSSLADLAVIQLQVEAFTATAIDPYTGREAAVVGGEFGRIVRHEILGFSVAFDGGVSVYKTDHVAIAGFPVEDRYLLEVDCRKIELTLVSDFALPERGIPWGIRGVMFSQYVDVVGPDGRLKVEEREIAIDIEGDPSRYVAYYTKRIVDCETLATEREEKWKFVQGNPDPVTYTHSAESEP